MKLSEYQEELKYLYGKAVENKDFRLAFDLLEVRREYCVDLSEIKAAREAENADSSD